LSLSLSTSLHTATTMNLTLQVLQRLLRKQIHKIAFLYFCFSPFSFRAISPKIVRRVAPVVVKRRLVNYRLCTAAKSFKLIARRSLLARRIAASRLSWPERLLLYWTASNALPFALIYSAFFWRSLYITEHGGKTYFQLFGYGTGHLSTRHFCNNASSVIKWQFVYQYKEADSMPTTSLPLYFYFRCTCDFVPLWIAEGALFSSVRAHTTIVVVVVNIHGARLNIIMVTQTKVHNKL